MTIMDLSVDRNRLEELCRRFRVARLEVFGSFARGEAGAQSDVDILVTFQANSGIGLEFVALKQELESLLNRRVDLLTRASVERSPNKYFRRFALANTEPLYRDA